MIEMLGEIIKIVSLAIKVLKEAPKRLKQGINRLITNSFVISIVIALILALNVLLVIEIFRISQLIDTKRAIPISVKAGGIYNASGDQPGLYPEGGRIRAEGSIHQNTETKEYISFSYRLIEGRKKMLYESSGCYLTFYDSPIDFRLYRLLTFSIKGNGHNGNPNIDLGIRLVVDDPKAPLNEKERVIREVISLQAIGVSISNHWKNLSVDLVEFIPIVYKRPLPKHIDSNMINKIVFLVDNEIVDRCPGGEICIKDIAFEK